MKYLIKKFWLLATLLIIISVPIIIICAYRTDKYLILKGATMPFTSCVQIENSYDESGSFSTVYVTNMNKSTIFQNLVTKNDPQIESGTLSYDEVVISDFDHYTASKIQYDSSIETALILAYNEAAKTEENINLDYKFASYDITYMTSTSSFQVGDKIIGVNDVNNDNEELLLDAIHNMKIGDIYKIMRKNVLTEIEIKKGEGISFYPRFTINMDNTTPKFNIVGNLIGGPSGGLMQALSIYNRITKEDLTHGLKICGTGTISTKGEVGMIGGIREKIPTAINDEIDLFFCVSGNYNDALESYNSSINRTRMKLIKVDTFYDCVNYLKEGYKNDFKNLS